MGVHLQIPLIDNYNYYHGGKFVFLKWRGIDLNTSNGYSHLYGSLPLAVDNIDSQKQ